jgi:hypothetical protein
MKNRAKRGLDLDFGNVSWFGVSGAEQPDPGPGPGPTARNLTATAATAWVFGGPDRGRSLPPEALLLKQSALALTGDNDPEKVSAAASMIKAFAPYRF